MKKNIFIAVAVILALVIKSNAQSSSSVNSNQQIINNGKAISSDTKKSEESMQGDVVPTGQIVWIQSENNVGRNDGGYWDVPGSPPPYKDGMNIQSWDIDNGSDRNFRIEKIPEDSYYRIFIDYSNYYCINLKGNESKNGQNIHIWSKNNSDAQKFYFQKQNNGSYKIFHISGRLICLSGRSSENGSNIHLWDDHNGPWVEWSFVDPRTRQVIR